MSKHVADALVMIPDAEAVLNAVCTRSRIYCRSVSTFGIDGRLDFGDGCAILSASDEGLRLQVEADDLVTFYGIRTLLQGFLFSTTTIPGDAVEWHCVSDIPPGAVRARAGNGQGCRGRK